MCNQIFNWGILGAGKVANDFAYGLTFLKNAKLFAIGSVGEDNRNHFCKNFSPNRIYSDYESLVNDPLVDIIYIATPNFRHARDMELCLSADKPFLCEKPFAMNSVEAQNIFSLAKKKKIFCMEAMWMRFMPLIIKTKKLIDAGAIGKIINFSASFGYPTEFKKDNRFFDLGLGGGALLDRAVYPISLALYLFSKPHEIKAIAHFGSTGVDEQVAALFYYADGKIAELSSGLTSYSSNSAIITGTKGKITIDPPFCRPNKLTINNYPEAPVVLSSKFSKEYPYEESKTSIVFEEILGNGFAYEAAEAMTCLSNGALESKIMPHLDTIEVLKVIDHIRSLIAK